MGPEKVMEIDSGEQTLNFPQSAALRPTKPEKEEKKVKKSVASPIPDKDGKGKKPAARTDSRSNLMGKFTQSVRRIVQDVRDEGAPSGKTKEEAMKEQLRLHTTRRRLEYNYETAKTALVNLHGEYDRSKETLNPVTRYALLKTMIKQVARLETEYWTLVDFPKQEKQEPVHAYVLRACTTLEKINQNQREVNSTELEERLRDERERLEDMTSTQIEAENTQIINDLYRLLKRYTGLRNLIRKLSKDYVSSKYYPMFPRYHILKELIRNIVNDPNYMEVFGTTMVD